ncbi:MAG: agmatinase family protein [Bacteroidetes bacterium]|nr:agmatinase family protein [Bacteroidota bacterium]
MSKDFNPNSAAQDDAGIFGLPFSADESQIIIIPVPWEVTVSYGGGTAAGPAAVFDASMQVDLYHHDFPELWKKGIYMDKIPDELLKLSESLRPEAEKIIEAIQQGVDAAQDLGLKVSYKAVNQGCEKMVAWVKARAAYWKSKGKIVGLLGGDHSTPLGYMQYLGEQHSDYGVLVLDAHYDLRNAYEGFKYSHASIFYNVLETVPQISKLIQVGIRDYCEEEKNYALSKGPRVQTYFDREIRKSQFKGQTWDQICHEIVNALPQKVYISVDIDGFDPKLCPNTGTPVAGGLEYEEGMHLFNVLKASGKEIIGFDLNEVSPGDTDWDGNVGARVLFHLCGLAAK